MKTIEFCLDEILRVLKKNLEEVEKKRKTDKHAVLERMYASDLASRFGLDEDYERHEFIISMIQKLEKDGHIIMRDNFIDKHATKIDIFLTQPMISAFGFNFIENEGGYTEQTKKIRRKRLNDIIVNWVIAVAAIIAAIPFVWKSIKFIHAYFVH